MRSLLCVANFTNAGYAWDFIEELYGGIADRLSREGIRTYVAYPPKTPRDLLGGARGHELPRPLEGSSAIAVELPVRLLNVASVARTVAFVRRHRVVALYLSDRAAWHPAFLLFRLAGVRWIVVHDHTSGPLVRPKGVRRLLTSLAHAIPGMMANRVVAVSDFVARRKVEADLIPTERVVRIWNAIEVPEDPSSEVSEFLRRYDIPQERALVTCIGRLTGEKGVDHLFRAFDVLLRDVDRTRPRPLLVCVGVGPEMQALQELRHSLEHAEDILMLGYVENAKRYLGAATVAVVPSVWEEAFGLAALEPMAYGVPVIASAVGGLPEVVEQGRTGLLVPPGDELALAAALRELLDSPDRRAEMGRLGRARARQLFDFDAAVSSLTGIVSEKICPSDSSVS